MNDVRGISVDAFRQQLRSEVEAICKDLGLNKDNEKQRGLAFQHWFASVLAHYEGFDLDTTQCVFGSNDLKFDIAFDDSDIKALYFAQTKYVNINQNPLLLEEEVNDFFSRHNILLNQREWVQKHASDELFDLVADYEERLADGWIANFYFTSTGKASDRCKSLVQDLESDAKAKYPNVAFFLHDFYDLKEVYIQSQSLEQEIAEHIDIQFPEARWLIKDKPYPTILAAVKGNALVALYRKERERIFAYNIRSFLGKRLNRDIIKTAKERPAEFYYFNNGVSAICTEMHNLGHNKFRFSNFQIINGAQTVGALHSVKQLSSDCEVALRVTVGESVKTEKGFNADIIRFNNTQNIIKSSDFRSNDAIQLWLEDKFSRTKPRGAMDERIVYVRKRSFKRVRGAFALKFEELAKIRYAYLFEPTRCIADPRSLWTFAADGGAYEKAFGVHDELEDIWDEATFRQTLFAVLVFRCVMSKIIELMQKDRKNLFMKRMRYFALALAHDHLDARGLSWQELLDSEAKFQKWFSEFWRDVVRDLLLAHQQAVEAKISTFALARNEQRWAQLKERFTMFLQAAS